LETLDVFIDDINKYEKVMMNFNHNIQEIYSELLNAD